MRPARAITGQNLPFPDDRRRETMQQKKTYS
jgi:hypothetical protein